MTEPIKPGHPNKTDQQHQEEMAERMIDERHDRLYDDRWDDYDRFTNSGVHR